MQLPYAEYYESQMAMHTSTANTDISLAKDFQKNLSDSTSAHDFWITVSKEKVSVNGSGLIVSIMYRKVKTCHP